MNIGRVKAWLFKPLAKRVVLLLCFVPFGLLTAKVLSDSLGANPAEALIRSSGDWTIRMLCLVLFVTPLRVMTNTVALQRFRRMIGVSVFGYATLHLLCYAGFDMNLDMQDIIKDIGKRPFIWVGFVSWVCLSLLALTSNNAALKWMGVNRWQTLHRLVYLVAVLSVLHFYWMRAGKHNFNEVIVYAVILGSLLLWRVVRAWRGKTRLSNQAHG